MENKHIKINKSNKKISDQVKNSKGNEKQLQNNKHKEVVLQRLRLGNSLVEFCAMVRNQMYIAVCSMSPQNTGKVSDFELVVRFSQIKVKNADMHSSFLKTMRGLARNVFGVYQPKIWMKSADDTNGGTPVMTNAGSTLVNSFAIQSSTLASIALLWAIFDEYRPVGPFHCYFYPSDTSTNRLYGLGVIDYTTSTNLASVSEAMSYDTVKKFDVTPYQHQDNALAEWTGHLDGIPDLTWIATGTGASWAYWKTYSFNANDSSWAISTTYGWWTFKVLLEFRQLNQGG